MSSSSSDVTEQVESPNEESETFPEWVTSFLARKFFEKCGNHGENQRYELNRYCTTCNEATCRNCVAGGHHKDHEVLTIYRHVYQNVVPLTQMETHIDCTKIQPYKCNKKWVVSLTPLPHNGSGSLIEGDGACLVCRRKLTDSERFRFCSIACKVSGSMSAAQVAAAEQGSSAMEEVEEPENEKGRKRSRKGVPRRAAV